MRFTCWIPEHGDTEGDSRVVDADEAEEAAESYAELLCHRDSANYKTFSDGPVKVMVRAVEEGYLYEVDVFGEATFSFYGREGDDEAVTMRVGDTITLEMLHRLEGCLRVGAWMLEEAAERARIACDVCAPTTALSTGTPRVPAHERPTCCPWYSEHEWCATARPAPAAGPTGTRTGSGGR